MSVIHVSNPAGTCHIEVAPSVTQGKHAVRIYNTEVSARIAMAVHTEELIHLREQLDAYIQEYKQKTASSV